MKKVLLLLLFLMTGLIAAKVPGTIHFIFDNGEVSRSGEDVFYEFDILAYISGTVNDNDLLLGSANIYIKYDMEMFGNTISGTESLEYSRIGLLATEILPGLSAYDVFGSKNTYKNVFNLTFEALLPGYPSYYQRVSTDSTNPTGLFHIKMKAIDHGTNNLTFPADIISKADEQFWTLSRVQYNGADFSRAVQVASIDNPIDEKPFSILDLDFYELANKNGRILLKWRNSRDYDAVGYVIKRALALNSEQYGAFEIIASYMTNDGLLINASHEPEVYYYWDKNVRPGAKYAYIIQEVDDEGRIRENEAKVVQIKDSKVIYTDEFRFFASYPNPFNPAFIVPFEIYKSTKVDIRLYGISGKLHKIVTEQEYSAGEYKIMVNCDDLSSGVYILKTQVGNLSSTQKMLLVK